jgi:NTP pyrophosphatase (non-canonical NTP hydrolase)
VEENKMKFSEYQELSKRTMPSKVRKNQTVEEFLKDSISNYIMGLAGETGEFIDLVKKEFYHGHPKDDDKKKKELGDILHYWVGLCTYFGYSAEEVATYNIFKLQKRYPKGFSVEDSIKRVDVE